MPDNNLQQFRSPERDEVYVAMLESISISNKRKKIFKRSAIVFLIILIAASLFATGIYILKRSSKDNNTADEMVNLYETMPTEAYITEKAANSETMVKSETKATSIHTTRLTVRTTVNTTNAVTEKQKSETEPVIRHIEQTPEQKIYNAYYDKITGGDSFVITGGGYFYDLNDDGTDEIIMIGTNFGSTIYSYQNGVIESTNFGFMAITDNCQTFIAHGMNGEKYIYCRKDEGGKSFQFYYNPYNNKEMEIDITYFENSDGSYNADWNIRDPNMQGGFWGFYDGGNEKTEQIYGQSENCHAAALNLLTECGFNLSDSSENTELDYYTYSEMKSRLLDLSGKSSQLFDENNEDQPVYGSGYVNIDSGTLNLRSAPSTDSEILAELPDGAKFNVLDDSNEGWLYVVVHLSEGFYYGYLAEEYTIWNIN